VWIRLCTRLLREKEVELEANLPIRAELWPLHVVKCTDVAVHRLLTYAEDSSNATTKGNRPLVAARGFPIGSDDWLGVK
jgi:hypothetical protein